MKQTLPAWAAHQALAQNSFFRGLAWRPIFEHESAFAIGDMAVSQSHPNTVWVGMGEA
jgi:hypothetical protein